ncbi:MAG: hypothetical protein M1823_004851 [Watsoniomyces obsoletus]|nr:MAG: hypothetical protein M1823_004851 [Watsoniomyces obsoletus]
MASPQESCFLSAREELRKLHEMAPRATLYHLLALWFDSSAYAYHKANTDEAVSAAKTDHIGFLHQFARLFMDMEEMEKEIREDRKKKGLAPGILAAKVNKLAGMKEAIKCFKEQFEALRYVMDG